MERDDSTHGVALVDIATGVAELIPNSQLDHVYPSIAWSPQSDRLYFSAGDGRIMSYTTTAPAAEFLSVTVEEKFYGMVTH